MENQMISLKCRKCGAVIHAEQKKCPKCGAPILLKVMMEEEKRHLPAKEIREKDKRMRREYEKINKEKEIKRQKEQKKEEKKERARQKTKAELELLQKKEAEKAAKEEAKRTAKEEKQKAKEEKAVSLAKQKEDKKAQKLAKKEAKSKGKIPVWSIVLIITFILALFVAGVLFINQPTADEPIPETEIEVTEETEAPQEEPLDVPEEEEIPAEQEPEPEPEPTEEAPKEPEPAQKTVRNITRNNYLFPSDSKYLTESDVNGLSQFDTGLIRNEIYAKKGYVFKDEPYKSYFNSQAWYNPNPSAKMRLNEIEKYNVNFLLEYERSQGWR